MRRGIAALVVVGLGAAIVLLWPRTEPEDPPGTVAVATTTTSTTPTTQPTAQPKPETTTATTADGHVVETVEEAEEILRDLWFGWFEGIYNEDEERIREVVGNPARVDDAVDQFGVAEFLSPPTRDGIKVQEVEILRSDVKCLAIWARIAADFKAGSLEGVHVFRPNLDGWLLVNTWPLRDDLWETDCEAVLQP